MVLSALMCVAAAHRYFSRAEMGMLGLHFPPLAGIDRTAMTKELPAGCPGVSHSPEICSLDVLQLTCTVPQASCMKGTALLSPHSTGNSSAQLARSCHLTRSHLNSKRTVKHSRSVASSPCACLTTDQSEPDCAAINATAQIGGACAYLRRRVEWSGG